MSPSSLWFSFNFDSSIISASLGWPLGATTGLVAAAGEMAVSWANAGIVINAAKRLVKNREVFMTPIVLNKLEIRKEKVEGISPAFAKSTAWRAEVCHGEWSEPGSRDIGHRTRGARVRERDAIEPNRPSADQRSESAVNAAADKRGWFSIALGEADPPSPRTLLLFACVVDLQP